MTDSEYDRIVRRMIEAAGHLTQSFGIGRALGQIFAYLYFSNGPRSLDDITDALAISKGSVSIGVRQLEQWEALEKVWVKGDRKDYYRATTAFGRIAKNAMAELVGTKMSSSAGLIAEAEKEVMERSPTETNDVKFVRERLRRLRAFQGKAQGMWENFVLKMLLK